MHCGSLAIASCYCQLPCQARWLASLALRLWLAGCLLRCHPAHHAPACMLLLELLLPAAAGCWRLLAAWRMAA
jgi:hypothetical protein